MLELNHQFRVVDVHAALEAGESASAAEDLERELHQAGIVRAAVFPGPRERAREGEGYIQANNAVARSAVQRPLVAFARISGPLDPSGGAGSRLRNLAGRRAEWHTAPTDVRQYGYNDRFAGFRLDPTVDGLPDDEVLAALEEVGLPVLVHGGQGFPPAAVESSLLAYDFPTVLAHFGGHPLDEAMMDEAIGLLEANEDLYLDTAAVRYRSVLERAIREHPDRVLFGSGSPAVHPSVAVMEVLTLDVPEDAMRKVFSKNPSRVIGELAPESQQS